MTNRIFIETNENDFMLYFMEAGYSIESLINAYTLDDFDKERFKDVFMLFTKSYYKLIEDEDLHDFLVEELKAKLEVYFNEEAESYYQDNYVNGDFSNGSHIWIKNEI